MQILEEGRLTDSQGRSVDFRNTVLIMTSNLGTADLRKANLGFTKADEAVSYERMKEKVQDALKMHFRPEFLNRIDETIVFHGGVVFLSQYYKSIKLSRISISNSNIQYNTNIIGLFYFKGVVD